MTRSYASIKLLLVICFALTVVSAAQAQSARTWVSALGDDMNPCSRTAPCKSFGGAISKTITGGEISVLDPGGYGTLSINKALTVDGGTGAGWGSVLASGITGFTVNITTGLATDKVILRNLSINCNSTNVDGIRFLAGKELHVQNVDIFQCLSDGIEVNAPASGTMKVFVKNTSVRNSGNGINILSAGATVNASVDECDFANNSTGALVQAGTLNISNSNITGHTGVGLAATGSVGSVINADNNVITDSSGSGVTAASASGLVRLNNNSIHRNGSGIANSGGIIQSCGNNKNYGNTTDVIGAIVPVPAPANCGQ